MTDAYSPQQLSRQFTEHFGHPQNETHDMTPCRPC